MLIIKVTLKITNEILEASPKPSNNKKIGSNTAAGMERKKSIKKIKSPLPLDLKVLSPIKIPNKLPTPKPMSRRVKVAPISDSIVPLTKRCQKAKRIFCGGGNNKAGNISDSANKNHTQAMINITIDCLCQLLILEMTGL